MADEEETKREKARQLSRQCGACYWYKNGCDFSESELPEEILKNYVACGDFLIAAEEV